MTMLPKLSSCARFLVQGCLGATLCIASAAHAADDLALAVGSGEVIKLSEPAAAVFVADPAVADVHVPSPGAVFVLGKKAGTTTLFALAAGNRTILRRTITVSHNVAALDRLLTSRFPTLKLTLASAPGSLMVSGRVANAADADAVVQTLTPYLNDKETLLNRMTLTRPVQVNLRVRITEVNRTVTQQLGINLSALGTPGRFAAGVFSGRPSSSIATPPDGAFSVLGSFISGKWNLQGVLDALDQEGLITVLAEPNLTTLSGESASFLAGGEIPVPISQQLGTISVEYKQFGVSLDFTPTVLADNRISLKIRPEVSEIDPTNSVTIGNIKVPGLAVRRLDTTVELSSGQSFALGGLLQSNSRNVISQLPGIGSLPVLGKLFSSKDYQNNKTELVVIVTPYLVQPTDTGRLRTPLDSLMSPSGDIEYILQRQVGLDPLSGTTPRLVGNAGFVY